MRIYYSSLILLTLILSFIPGCTNEVLVKNMDANKTIKEIVAEEKKQEVQPPQNFSEIKTLDKTNPLSEIEQELNMIIEKGSKISPQRFAEINLILAKFENGSEKERVDYIRTILQNSQEEHQEMIPAIQNEIPYTDKVYADLQNQIKKIESVKGEINTELYNKVLAEINNLSAEGYDPDKMFLLNKSFHKVTATDCVTNPNPVFSHYFIDLAYVTNILPPPNIAKSSGHLKTHSYVNTEDSGLPVYAPVNMSLINGVNYVGGPYSLTFQVSCEVKIRFAHLTEPVQKIKDVLSKEPTSDTASEDKVYPAIFFKEGELVGYSGGPPYVLAAGLDFGVYNTKKPNRYADSQNPEIIQSEFYTTADCPYDYFTPKIRAEYESKFHLLDSLGMTADGASFCQ